MVVVVSRCAHMDDCLDRKMYPLQTHKNLVHTNKCAVCNIYIARYGSSGLNTAAVYSCKGSWVTNGNFIPGHCK